MKPGDLIAIGIIVVIIGLAAFYIYKAKKSGKKCIGCPDSGSCGSHSCHCCEGHAAEKETAETLAPPSEEQKPEEQSGCDGNCGSCCCCGDKNNKDQ